MFSRERHIGYRIGFQPERRMWWAGLLTSLLLFIGLHGCGYQLAGSGELPGGIKTIAVSVLANRTGQSGLETEVTNALIDELTRRRQDLVVTADRADAVLSGTINSLATRTLTRSGSLTATERRLVITASLVLKDRNGEILWQRSSLTAEQAYAVTSDRPTSDRNRLLAIGEVSRRLAEYAYDRLTDTF